MLYKLVAYHVMYPLGGVLEHPLFIFYCISNVEQTMNICVSLIMFIT